MATKTRRLPARPEITYQIAGVEYVTYVEAARRLGVSREMIRRNVARGRLKSLRLTDRILLIPLDGLSAYTPDPKRVKQVRAGIRAARRAAG